MPPTRANSRSCRKACKRALARVDAAADQFTDALDVTRLVVEASDIIVDLALDPNFDPAGFQEAADQQNMVRTIANEIKAAADEASADYHPAARRCRAATR